MSFGDNTTTSETSIPKWLEKGSKFSFNQAKDFYKQDYGKYKGERVAAFTPAQTNAFSAIENWAATPSTVPGEAIDLTRGAATAPGYQLAPTGGQYNYGSGGAGGAYQLGGGGSGAAFNPTDYGRIVDENGALGKISDYVNPYVSNALDPAIREIERAATAERMRLGDRATAANAYGDARHGVMEGVVDRNRTEAIGDTAYRAFSDAYNNAMAARQADVNRFGQRDLAQGNFYEAQQNRGLSREQMSQRAYEEAQARGLTREQSMAAAYEAWQGRALTADTTQAGLYEQALGRQMGGAAQMVSLDTAGQQNEFAKMLAGLNVGNQQQQQAQNSLDTNYEAWQLKKQDEYDRLAALIASAGGVPYSRTTSTTQPDNSWAQLLGAGVGAILP